MKFKYVRLYPFSPWRAFLTMKYNRFEELPVWKDAIELAVRIYELTARPAFRGYYSLKDQLERAGVSISNNIAEGFERGLLRRR